MSQDREAVKCRVCGSDPGQLCDFPNDPAPMVEDTDGPRRAVHAARYADTMPPEERGPFWDAAVEKYLTTELALMNGAGT